MRLLHLLVIGALMFAAAYVYRIKMDSTVRTERILKLHAEIREERDKIAVLRAEWAQARSAAAPAGPGRTPFAAEAAQRQSIDDLRNLSRAAAKPGQAGRSRSDRFDDRDAAKPAADVAARDRLGRQAGGSAMTGPAMVKPTRPGGSGLIRSLLYGRNVDRTAKARARVGLAILAFAAIYAVIGGRLVMYAIGADSHGARRTAAQDAIATARPDIVDRNGEILATDVKAPSLFAEPRRIIDKDEAIELLTATLPDLDVERSARAPVVEEGLRLAEARDHAEAAAGHPPSRHSRHRLPAREQARLSERQRGRASDRPRQHRQPGHRRHGEVARRSRARRPASRRLRHRPPARPVELSVDLRVQHALRDELLKAKREIPRQGGVRPRHRRQDRRGRRDGLGAGFRSQQSRRKRTIPTASTASPIGVYEMGSTFKAFTLAMALDTGKIRSQLDVRRARAAALRQVHDPRLRRRRAAS